jgi:uncharacterized protein YoxC
VFNEGWEKKGCLAVAVVLAAIAFAVILISLDQFLQPAP